MTQLRIRSPEARSAAKPREDGRRDRLPPGTVRWIAAVSLGAVALSGVAIAAPPAPGPTGKPAPKVAPGAAKESAAPKGTAAAAASAPAASAPAAPAAADAKPGAPAAPAVPAADVPKPEAPAGTKVLVLPIQAIYRSVPQRKLDDATGLLHKELEQLEGLSIIRGAVAAATGAPENAPTLDAPRAAAQAAEAAEGARDIQKAIEEWKKAVALYEQNAAALDIIDANEFIFANLYLARAYMMAGMDKEAKERIDLCARMAPSFEMPREAFSRLFQRWFAETAAVAIKEPRGSVAVASALPGASVALDGRAMDVAPVQIDDIVPGRHLITVRIEGAPPFATLVSVAPGKKAEVSATFMGTAGGSAVGRVTDAIALNSLPKPAVESAAAAGKEAGASYVIVGGMSKDDDRFRVHTFVVEVKDSKIAPLDTVSFDLEMLTAESDVLRIAKAAQTAIGSFPSSSKNAVEKVEAKIKAASTINKVSGAPDYVPPGSKVVATPGKKKDGPRPVFRPLKGGKVLIKDEEE